MEKHPNDESHISDSTWIMVETDHGTIDMPLDLAQKINERVEKNLPKTYSDEQKNRVVSKLMSRLWGDTVSVQEAPYTPDVVSPTWSSAPSSSSEYSAYKKKIHASVSFESVVGKINPYTGYRIKTQQDYDLYCDFLLQQKINDIKLSNASDKISKLEAELSSLRKQFAQQSNSKTSNESCSQNELPIQKPFIKVNHLLDPPKRTEFPQFNNSLNYRSRYRSGDRSVIVAILIFLVIFWFAVIQK